MMWFDHMKVYSQDIPLPLFHPSRHHQNALTKSIASHTKFIYVESKPDKWLATEPAKPTAASKRRKGPKKTKIEQPPDKNIRIAVESRTNVRNAMLRFLNDHFTHENTDDDGNEMNYVFPTEIASAAAREQNKADSGDETEDDEEVVEGFELPNLKDDATP